MDKMDLSYCFVLCSFTHYPILVVEHLLCIFLYFFPKSRGKHLDSIILEGQTDGQRPDQFKSLISLWCKKLKFYFLQKMTYRYMTFTAWLDMKKKHFYAFKIFLICSGSPCSGMSNQVKLSTGVMSHAIACVILYSTLQMTRRSYWDTSKHKPPLLFTS